MSDENTPVAASEAPTGDLTPPVVGEPVLTVTYAKNPPQSAGKATIGSNLTPEQKAALAAKFGRRRGVSKQPDGSLLVELRIEPESAALLESWAESAGQSLDEYIPPTIAEALAAYCQSTAG